MSFFAGYDFYFFLILFLIPAIVLGMLGKSLRVYRMVITFVFIWMVYNRTPMQLIYLMLYVAFSVCLVKIYVFLRKKYARNRFIYGSAVLLALLPLVINKLGGVCEQNWFGFLGISYICFRVIQVLIETYDGVITEIDETRFLMFLLFFPSLSSGPIDRSRRFAEDDRKIYSRLEYIDLLEKGIFKLVLGAFYKIVCSAILYEWLITIFAKRYNPIYLIGYAYVYGFYMFFDFAGYSAMAVGTSYILGIKMPDNFNKPFLSIDIKDFWNRWHITLSTWFRDFVFTRFMLDSVRKKRFRNRLHGAFVGLVLNMFVMGIWHGLEAHYIAYGLYHGIILGFTEIYQKKSAFYREYKEQRWYRILSWFITLNIAMLGFLIFSGRVQDVLDVAIMNLQK